MTFREDNNEDASAFAGAEGSLAALSERVIGAQSEGVWIEESLLSLIRFDPVIPHVIDIAIVPVKHP